MKKYRLQHKVPKNFWDIAMDHVTEVSNMMPVKIHGNRAPIYMWTGKIPDVSKLRVFGCLAHAHLDGKKLPKLEPRQFHAFILDMPQMVMVGNYGTFSQIE